MLAGVCEGIGARYSIDPLIVRIAFVALAFTFGGGIFLYLLFWLNMPLFGTTVSPWRAINMPNDRLTQVEKDQRNTGWALLVGLFIFLPSIAAGDGSWAASWVVTVVAGATAIYLLHRARPVAPEGLLPRPADLGQEQEHTPASTQPQGTALRLDTSNLTVPEGYEHPAQTAPTPPSWDPLGAAPGLWHLPEPPEAPAQEQPRTRANPLRWILIGLIPLAVALSVAAAAFTLGVPWFSVNTENSNMHINVSDHLEDTYDSSVGTTRIDLSELEPLKESREVTIDHGIGTVEIIAPKNVRVEMTCDVGVGTEDCPPVINDDAEGRTLRLNAHVGIGSITVRDAA